LLVRAVGDELVIYDPASHTAHHLNRRAAAVFQAADGRTSRDAIAARLADDDAADEAAVSLALEQLDSAGLLEPMPSTRVFPSRRDALLKLGLGAASLAPIVTSLAIPTPAEAAATCVQAAQCTALNPGNQCYVLAQAECTTKICTGVPGDCQ
jgi:hypothetical protein